MVLARMLWSTHEGMCPLMMTTMRISFLTTMRDHVSPSYSLDCAYYRLLNSCHILSLLRYGQFAAKSSLYLRINDFCPSRWGIWRLGITHRIFTIYLLKILTEISFQLQMRTDTVFSTF